MKRLTLAFAAVLALGITSTAAASDSPFPIGPHAFLYGKVVSVDAAAGTITANVFVPPAPPVGEPGGATGPTGPAYPLGVPPSPGSTGPSGPEPPLLTKPPAPLQFSSPAPQLVTITTTASTVVRLDDQPSSLGALAAGDIFVAGFDAAPGSSLDQILAGPAVGINAHSPRVFYGFAGTITGVDKTANTLTLGVLGETPAARNLGVTRGQSLTLTIGAGTLALEPPYGPTRGTSSLDGVSVGDIAAAGYLAPANETLAGLLATPVGVLIDIPMASLTGDQPGSTLVTHARSRALKLAASMVRGKRSRGHKAGKHRAVGHGKRK